MSEFGGKFRRNTLPAKDVDAPLDASEKLRLVYLTGQDTDPTVGPDNRLAWHGLDIDQRESTRENNEVPGQGGVEVRYVVGPEGLQGPAGPPGPQGPAGPAGASSFTFSQGEPSTEWVITHPLAFTPNVTIVDSTGEIMYADVHYESSSQIRVLFDAPIAGQAFLS